MAANSRLQYLSSEIEKLVSKALAVGKKKRSPLFFFFFWMPRVSRTGSDINVEERLYFGWAK